MTFKCALVEGDQAGKPEQEVDVAKVEVAEVDGRKVRGSDFSIFHDPVYNFSL